ncbi:hypothetical protein BGZ58_010092 [Dissophora ornata]|nr:hypothetical protein BGZ58_010092 [Dissophora ornata]
MEQSEQQIGSTGVELNPKQQPERHDTTIAHNSGFISMQPSYQSNTSNITPFTTTPSTTTSSSSLQPPLKDDLVQKMSTLRVEDQHSLATTAAPPKPPSLSRRASLILATAASNAVEAASNVVTTARRLVLNDEGDEDLEDTSVVEEKQHHHGLSFSQRHLSVKQNKKPLEDECTSAAAATASGNAITPDVAIPSAYAVAPAIVPAPEPVPVLLPKTVPAPAPVPAPASTLPPTTFPTTTSDFFDADVGSGIYAESSTIDNAITPAAVSDAEAFSLPGMKGPENKALTAVQYPDGNRSLTGKASPTSAESADDGGNMQDNPTALSGADNTHVAVGGTAAPTTAMDDLPMPEHQPSSIRSMPILGIDRRTSNDTTGTTDDAKAHSLLEEPFTPAGNGNNISGTGINNNTTTNTVGPPKTINTMYVAHRGSNSSRSQAMNVDRPSVSSIMGSSTTRSGMGVDAPHLVGGPEDLHKARGGGLNVDGKLAKAHPHDDGHDIHVPQGDPTVENREDDVEWAPIQTSRGPSQVLRGNIHHKTQNTLPDARAAISRNPYEAYMSHHRHPTSSGMGVDEPLIPTINHAGSGSADNTNLNRPAGTYNSAFNVDKAGSPGNSRTGMGVDKAATTVNHMVSADDHRIRYKEKTWDDTASSHTSGSRARADGDHGSIINKVKNAFRPGSTATSESTNIETTRVETAAAASTTGLGIAAANNNDPTMAPGPTTTTAATPVAFEAPINTDRTFPTTSSSVVPSITIPAGYDGPIPEVAPGEKLAWVKRIVKTDIYEDEGNYEGGGNGDGFAPVEVQQNEPRKKGHFSFFDRLRNRHHSSVDKGKRRT